MAFLDLLLSVFNLLVEFIVEGLLKESILLINDCSDGLSLLFFCGIFVTAEKCKYDEAGTSNNDENTN